MKRLIILGAGKNKNIEDNPSHLILNAKKTFLNWQIETGALLECERIDYVGGYQLVMSQMEKFPELHVTINQRWGSTKSLFSLLLLSFEADQDLFVSYSDVLLHETFLKENFCKTDVHQVTALIDKTFPKRYSAVNYNCEIIHDNGRPTEFVGFVYIPKEYVTELVKLQKNIEDYAHWSLADFLKEIQLSGVPTKLLDASSHWCDANFSKELPRFIIKGKARTLANLKRALNSSYFLEQASFSAYEWKQNPEAIYNQIQRELKTDYVAIRSSAFNEDSFTCSKAGVYQSHLGVALTNFDGFKEAVNRTIASYKNGHSNDDLVLIQPYIADAYLHGVVFTKSHNGGPYYVFNYGYNQDTSSITGGYAADSKTFILFRRAQDNLVPDDLKSVFEAIREIEEFLEYDSLDIEFLITNNKKCYILQVRPQVSYKHESFIQQGNISDELHVLKEQLQEKSKNSPLFEDMPTVFAVMPDWNPAEIIGRKPSPLARSLYEEIITNETWAKQRAEFGYYNLVSYPLMQNLCGHPYIDVKASFLSFIPQTVNHKTALKLVKSSLEYLKTKPYLQDKVEFDVIPTCYQFDFNQHFKHIKEALDDQDHLEVKECYRRLTARAIDFNSKKLSYTPLIGGNQDAIATLIKNAQIGALAFAHEARKAFIATILLKSLVRVAALSQDELDQFYRSLNTVSKEFTQDAYFCKMGQIKKEAFVAKYGHLRPGTYDITAPRYDSSPSTFIEPIIAEAIEPKPFTFVWKESTKLKVERYLQELDPSLEFSKFVTFSKNAIESREQMKFAFTRDISNALEKIAEFAFANDITRHDIAFCDFNFLKVFIRHPKLGKGQLTTLNAVIKQSKQDCELMKKIELPMVIVDQDSIFGFYQEECQPNFITSQKIIADFVVLRDNYRDSLENKAVFIENADPGYEWVFAENIGALITMYGGINSHMAVRAAELNIPSVIGIGEKKGREIMNARTISIDCLNKRLVPVAVK